MVRLNLLLSLSSILVAAQTASAVLQTGIYRICFSKSAECLIDVGNPDLSISLRPNDAHMFQKNRWIVTRDVNDGYYIIQNAYSKSFVSFNGAVSHGLRLLLQNSPDKFRLLTNKKETLYSIFPPMKNTELVAYKSVSPLDNRASFVGTSSPGFSSLNSWRFVPVPA